MQAVCIWHLGCTWLAKAQFRSKAIQKDFSIRKSPWSLLYGHLTHSIWDTDVQYFGEQSMSTFIELLTGLNKDQVLHRQDLIFASACLHWAVDLF